MSTHNRGAARPVEGEKAWYMVISPRGDQITRVTLLEDGYTGYVTHWNGVSIKCTEQPDCPGCASKLPWRWSGYVPVWDQVQSRRSVLTMATGFAKQLDLLAEQCNGLRGVIIEARRQIPEKVNSPVLVKFIAKEDPASIMEAHPIEYSLNRLWGLNQMSWRPAYRKGPEVPPGSNNKGRPAPVRGEDVDRRVVGRAEADARRHYAEGIGHGDF